MFENVQLALWCFVVIANVGGNSWMDYKKGGICYRICMQEVNDPDGKTYNQCISVMMT